MPEELIHPATDYAQKVVNGEIVACKKVVLACQRHLDFLNRPDMFFDEAAANRVYQFGENLKHIKGRWKSPFIILELWQKFVLGNIYGWKWVESGLRVFRTAYIQIPRKNGKSTLAAIIGLFMLIADGEPGAEVYSAATARDQARIVFDVAKAMRDKQPTLRKKLGSNKMALFHLASGSMFKPLSADSHTLDGLNIHCGLVDELHAHKDGKVWNVLDTGTGSRLQPLMVAITTAGFERSICVEKYYYAEQVLTGIIPDDSFFAFITEIEEDDDWRDPQVWYKANPNLGISSTLEQLERKCLEAQHLPSEQNNFLCKHLNKWVNQAERWINIEDWNACKGTIIEADLHGRECYGGLDLSSTTDITAFVLVFPPQEQDELWKAIYRFWVPKEKVAKRAKGYLVDKVPYDAWERDKFIITTPGNVIDYDFVRKEIVDLSQIFDLRQVGFDPFNATETATKLIEKSVNMVEFRQGAKSFNAPMKRFEEYLLDRRLNHGNHPTMGWMANNMVVRYDENMNMAPDKKNAKDKIDGVVAFLMGLGLAMQAENVYLQGYDEGIQFI